MFLGGCQKQNVCCIIILTYAQLVHESMNREIFTINHKIIMIQNLECEIINTNFEFTRRHEKNQIHHTTNRKKNITARMLYDRNKIMNAAYTGIC